MRPEAVREDCRDNACDPLRREPITFGIDAAGPRNYQHGTELWKYMTQYTLRLS